MKQHTLLRPLVGGALLLILAVPITAQPEPRGERGERGERGDGPPRGERGPRDGQRGGDRERGPRAKGELNRIWRDMADLEGGAFALSQTQASQIVALVLPVSKQPTLSDDAAKALSDKIEALLTDAQRAEIEKNRPRARGQRGGPRPDGPPPRRGEGRGDNERGGPRPDGPPPRDDKERGPRDGGPRPDGPPPRMSREDREKVRPFMEALNPFYPPTGYATFKDLPADFQKEISERWGEDRALLETLSRRAKIN